MYGVLDKHDYASRGKISGIKNHENADSIISNVISSLSTPSTSLPISLPIKNTQAEESISVSVV